MLIQVSGTPLLLCSYHVGACPGRLGPGAGGTAICNSSQLCQAVAVISPPSPPPRLHLLSSSYGRTREWARCCNSWQGQAGLGVGDGQPCQAWGAALCLLRWRGALGLGTDLSCGRGPGKGEDMEGGQFCCPDATARVPAQVPSALPSCPSGPLRGALSAQGLLCS